jgi:hypothetical protein
MKIDPHFIQPRHMIIAPPQAGISDLLIYTRSLPRQNAVSSNSPVKRGESRDGRARNAAVNEYPYNFLIL